MRKIIALLAGLSLAAVASAQSGPKFSTSGGVGSATSTFSGGEPNGGTYTINGTTGRVSTPVVNLRPGSAPASPQNGDCWTTVSGLFCRINDATVGPYGNSTGTVSQVGLVTPSIFTAGGAVTTTGNLSFTLNSQAANQVFAGPNGSSGTPGFRALVGADVPAINMAASGNGGITGTLGLANGGLGATTAAGGRSTLGLGTAATQNTGTSGAVIPMLNGANVWGASQTIDGYLTSSGTTADRGVVITANSGRERQVQFQTAGSARWSMGANAAAESGGSVGSDFAINRFNDAGSYLDAPFTINRASGVVGLSQPLPLTSGGVGSTTAAGARSNLGLGTAATQNTGTSGATIPLLNGSNTWSTNQIFAGQIAVDSAVMTGDYVELGQNRSGAGAAYIDLHSAAGTDFESRIYRGPGANSNLEIINTGTGVINFTGASAAFSSPVTASYFKPASADCANILHYGGNRTNSADNDAAFAAAASASQSSKLCVYFPSGTYRFNASQQVVLPASPTVSSVMIKGDGPDITMLNFANGTSGLSVVTNSASQSFHLDGFSVLGGTFSTSTDGISIYGAADNPNPAVNAPSTITNVIVRGNDGYSVSNGFGKAIILNAVSNVNLFNVQTQGPNDVTAYDSTCLYLAGRTLANAVAINVASSQFLTCRQGIVYSSSVEGLTVNQSNFVGNFVGIIVPTGSTDGAMLSVANSHFNAYVAGIDVEVDPGATTIDGNYFIVNTQIGSANGVILKATQDYTLTDNVFARQGTGLANGMVIGTYNTHSGFIGGNVFQNMGTAITLQSGSQRATVGTNSFAPSVTTKVSNSGTNNIVAATCSGAPTAGFTVTNGVITAC